MKRKSDQPGAARERDPARPRSGARNALRLEPAVRRRQILDAAIAYFAEAGLGAQTRELTRRIGVSQPLLYRYFPSKQALIAAVFDAVFMNQWDDGWLDVLRDRRLPLRERLLDFYRRYIGATYRPEWLRIYMFAGLAGFDFNRDYVTRIVEDRILTAICTELRADFVPAALLAERPAITPREIELAWTLQGSMFYWVVRKTLFHCEPPLGFDLRFGDSIDLFLAGARQTYPRLFEPAGEAAPPAGVATAPPGSGHDGPPAIRSSTA